MTVDKQKDGGNKSFVILFSSRQRCLYLRLKIKCLAYYFISACLKHSYIFVEAVLA